MAEFISMTGKCQIITGVYRCHLLMYIEVITWIMQLTL